MLEMRARVPLAHRPCGSLFSKQTSAPALSSRSFSIRAKFVGPS